MNKQQIAEIIAKLIKSEVRKQIMSLRQDLKQEIINELRHSDRSNSPSLRQLTETRTKSVQPAQRKQQVKRPNIQYSHNPILNDILSTTRPIDDDSSLAESILGIRRDSYHDEPAPKINIVRSGPEGERINFQNPAVQSVLEAMNRDYSDVISDITKPPAPKPVQQTRPSSTPVPNISNMRSSALNNITQGGFDDFEPDPFHEDW